VSRPVLAAGPVSDGARAVGRALVPMVAALVVGAIILAALGRNPLAFYGDLFRAGLVSDAGWQGMLTRLAPFLLIGMGYIVAFRAGIWNIGGDGQFLLAAAVVAGLGPAVMGSMSRPAGLVVLGVAGFVVGGVWTILPAYLKAWFGVNEIITSVMMSFIGINLANLLIKGPWRSADTSVPQTDSVPLSDLLPRLGSTTIHVGIIVAVVAVVIVWYLLNFTAIGLRLTILGASPRAALHAGLNVKRMVVATFFVSGALVGLAAAVEILGVWGYMRADWNPKFGLALFALVFLARLSPLATIPLAAFYAILEIGGHEAARHASLDYDFVLILIGLILLFMAVSQYIRIPAGRRKDLLQRLAGRVRLRSEP
jgi:general nucleoside transport system permease protein